MSDQLVFINQNSGYLMIDIINAHKDIYPNRVLITGKLISRNTPLDSDVKIERIITYDRSSTLKRLWTWGIAFIQLVFLVKTKYRNADLYIVSNPPFAPLLPLFCGNRFYLLTFDVYPDALAEYKILKNNSFVIKLWKRANRKVFSKAEKLFTLSTGMKRLLQQYANERKIEVAPLWTDNTFLSPMDKSKNRFIATHGLQGKFIVMYSGNLGFTHNIEVIIELALRITRKDIFFVIIGEGDKKRLIEDSIREHRLMNCILLPWQEVAMLPHSLSAGDLAVVTLGKEASLLSVPSKVYNLMSVGVPSLCIASKQSELASLVEQYHIGKCFDAEDLNSIISFIEHVASDPAYHGQLKQNAQAASRNFGIGNAKKLIAS